MCTPQSSSTWSWKYASFVVCSFSFAHLTPAQSSEDFQSCTVRTSQLGVGHSVTVPSRPLPRACTRHRTAQHTPTHNLYLRLLDKVRPESTASAFAYPYARICVSLSIADAFTASRHGVNTFGVQKTQRGARGENSIRPMVGVAISKDSSPLGCVQLATCATVSLGTCSCMWDGCNWTIMRADANAVWRSAHGGAPRSP